METLVSQLLEAVGQMSLWELMAVVLGIAYLLLAVRENILCWYAAFAQTLILTVLFWDASLLMESGLQVYYLAMAVYGWYQWRFHPGSKRDCLPVTTWTMVRHGQVLVVVLLLSSMSGFFLSRGTEAAWPYLDSFTTWASVATTYMVAKKILENWLYWVVIDTLSVFLYADRGLYLMALLFVAYVLIALIGFWQWRNHYRRDRQAQQLACPA